MLNYLFIFLCSVIMSYAMIRFCIPLFYKLNILDNPKKYQKKRDPIPYAMGIIFFVCFLVISYFFVDYDYKLGLIWVFGFFITGLSFLDDMNEVPAHVRLIFQIIIGAIIGVTSIKIGYISNIFGGIINLETYSFFVGNLQVYVIPLIFTILWYVFVFNALNWSDGVSGNTSGVSLISFFILFLLGVILFQSDNYIEGIKNAEFIMKMSLILVGILIPFWFFDVQERILMGDTGTMFLGFMLATLAIIAGGKIATVLVVFGIYSVDAVYVIIKRLLAKKNPLKGDFTHLHHRLEKIGLSKKQILTLIYSLCFFFGLTGLFLDKTGKIIVFGIIVVVVISLNKIVEAGIDKWKKIGK
ncbi:undecaprenyl/decaprenyl-phosphate alpha-N-acetylglucosaminyl 1-phosphate transferase [Candidatus Gracilibacteria bacterium]|nr:undecaprenyl/decaprenyl-phosphate alpha-N-acetylglucosaminyl 1-phosphate transferase [Candidatus Gracilibacteria bacterium]